MLSAVWIPGLPHLLSARKGLPWARLSSALEALGERVSQEKPDAIVVYSSQWVSVLGTSFQSREHLSGTHVDENWYEWGDLPFDFKSDVALSRDLAKEARASGFAAKEIDYESFPVDTGTLVAMRYLNPLGNIPVAAISSCVYYDAAKSERLGSAIRRAGDKSGKRILYVACSLLTTRFFTHDISPDEDVVSNAGDDERNRHFLEWVEAGDMTRAAETLSEMSRLGPIDMQGNAFHWLRGVLSPPPSAARVLAYGPLWGTGAAVIEWEREKR